MPGNAAAVLWIVFGLAAIPAIVLGQETANGPEMQWPAVTREMRPWTRWWWLGSAVDKANLTALLETYRKAGLGGVEITPIYGVKGQEARDLPYLSSEWMAMLRHTTAEANRLDMGVDMPTGTGWPFGGPQVRIEEAADRYAVAVHPVPGNMPFRLTFGEERPQALTAMSDKGETIPLLEKIDGQGRLEWTPPAGQTWTVYQVTPKWSKMKVKRAAPGGEGYCINPFLRESLTHYLTRFDAALADLPPGAVRCEFHDSFEYAANWAPNLFEEFKARRGYDLRDHLPAFAANGATEESARALTDYRETIGDLLLENFTQTWTAWAHARGSKSRNQAHGSPGNLLDLYGAVDIPETEVFHSIGDPRISKFASSAAHVMGRPLASSESCTWQSEHFTETLAQSKVILDRLLVAGINHIFYHGTAYSPADAAWPGWLFYASTHFEPNNPLWHDFPTLNAYVTRCQSLLQSGKPDNDILLYWPLSDLWQKNPKVFGLTIEGKWLESEPVGDTAQTLWNLGYAYDYVSDRQLATAKADTIGVQMPGGTYRVVLVPPCKYMPLDTLKSLLRLAEDGATILFQGGLPQDVPGLADLDKRRVELHHLISDLKLTAVGNLRIQKAIVGKGVVLIGANAGPLLEAARVRREAACDHAGVMCLRRSVEGGHIYLLVNQGKTALDGWIPLGTAARSVAIMDPMTGHTGVAHVRQTGTKQTQMHLQLQPGASLLLRTSERHEIAGAAWKYLRPEGEPIALQGGWNVRFLEGGPNLPKPFSLPNLASWTEQNDPEAQRFGGTARYTLVFDAPNRHTDSWELDLGDVHESARVRLNGQDLGTLILPPWQIRLPTLNPVGNVLEVDVTNLAANRIRDMDRRHVAWKIFHEINFVDIHYKPFDASDWPLHESGLLGPVRLIPMKAQGK